MKQVNTSIYPALFISLMVLFVLAGCAAGNKQQSLQIMDNGTVYDVEQELYWQQGHSRRMTTAAEAQEYVDSLRLGGYDDWRLPTRAEFHNLFFSYDFGKVDKKQADLNLETNYWIHDNDGKSVPGSWEKADTCCIVREFHYAKKGFVRAVRP